MISSIRNKRIKLFRQLLLAALVLSYPLAAHRALAFWPGLPDAILTLPPTLINAWLAWIFGRTLRQGAEPMISTFARIEQAQMQKLPNFTLPPEIAHYTRMLTQLWTALFVVMAIVSALLAWAGLLGWWALFTGIISYALSASLFFGEYAYRRIRFTQYVHANPLQLAWVLIKAGPIWLRRAP